jgi:hypothetical protein
MSIFLRQSTAVDVALGPFLDSTDGITAETGLTISQADVRLKKNAGAWAQVNDATSATHEENGWYEKELDATDTNTVGRLLIAVHESGAMPVWHEFWVLEEVVYDSLFAASAAGYQVPIWAAANSTVSLSATTVATVTTLTGHTAQTGDAFARLGAPAGASVSADVAAIKAQTAAIEVDTQDLQTQVGVAGAGLTAADDAVMTRLGAPAGASVSADVAAIKAQTAAIETDTAEIGAAGAGLTAITGDTDAIALAVDSILSLLDDAQAEPAQGAPAANADVVTKIAYLYQWARNRKQNDGTQNLYYADDATTVNQKQATSEAAGTVTIGEMATGA